MENQNDFTPLPRFDWGVRGDMPAIFNPYNQDSNGTALKPISNKEATIPDMLMRSDGSFGDNWGDSTTDSIHVYKITGETAALQVQIPQYSRTNGDSYAMGFYDKSLKEVYLDINEDSRASMAYRTSYLMWHFGSIARKEMIDRKDWIVVPREIFENIDDYVYLCICTEEKQGEPVVKIADFPKDKPFFYDLPVATSINKGQSIKDSKIILGRVMVYMNDKYTSLDGQYEWSNDVIFRYGPNCPTVEIQKRPDCMFLCSNNNVAYLCPEIELYIYSQNSEGRAKDVTAYVWQSGNEDDEVKKSYIKAGEENPYNTYSYVMDSLSTDTIYRSMLSLTKLTAENAARYVVRALAKQPEGFRCFSIDINSLGFLMGGALFKIESIIPHAFDEKQKVDTYDPYNYYDVVSIVDDLFTVNGSLLFFDTNVTYKDDIQEAVIYYMQNVLGIKEGSNGCMRIQSLLTDLFNEIHTLGIGLDYVYCDIEGPWNDARSLSSRRFSDNYFKKIDKDRNSFYNIDVLEELKMSKIWDEMQRRGFVSLPDPLSDVCSANDNPVQKRSFYGLNPETYPRRRNLNIWDAVMKGYENEMFYTYVMAPVLTYNPKAKCSVFEHGTAKGYVNHALRFETYLGGTVLQDSDIYSSCATYGDTPSEYYKKLCMDNWKMFPNKKNYFSYFVGYINKLRSLLVSTQSEKQKNGKFNAFFCSFNIWVNGYLQGVSEGETKQLVNQLNDENDKTISSLEAYYNEFMYHLFLCCPDKAIAYFQVEKKAIKNSEGTIEEGGTYYFPYGNYQDKTSYEKYFSDCYQRLQAVLVELNDIIGNSEYETMVNTLTSENEPYVISGIQLQNKRVWRVTLKEPIVTTEGGTNGTTITIENKLHRFVGLNDKKINTKPIIKQINIVIKLSNGRKISFTDVKDFKKSEFGLWVETSLSSKPIFSAKTSYYEDQNNLAYSSHISDNLNSTLQQDEIEFAGNNLRYLHPASHTVFGEMPNFITSSIQFTLKKSGDSNTGNHTGNNKEEHIENKIGKLTENYVLLLYNGEELFYPAIRKLDNSAYDYDISTWYERFIKDNNDVFIKKVQLDKGYSYELIKYVAFNNETNAETWTGRIRLELWSLDGDKSLVFSDERDITIDRPAQRQCYQAYFEIAQKDPVFNWDNFTVQEFKVYFTQQHEKLELFRESDGVNIGRVNKKVKAYADLPVETKCNDTLLGKLSWLNATDKPVKYAITFNMFNSSQELIGQQESTVEVEANSEGYIMISLPRLNPSTRKVEFTCEKPIELRKGVPTNFFIDHYNKNRKQTISIDISENFVGLIHK